jgi:hypothetical protein
MGAPSNAIKCDGGGTVRASTLSKDRVRDHDNHYHQMISECRDNALSGDYVTDLVKVR